MKFDNQHQTIQPVGFALGPYGLLGQRLFHLASCHPLPGDIGPWPKAILPLLRHLYQAAQAPPPAVQVADPIPPTPKPPKAKGGQPKAVVGFSGGKDSVAVAAMLAAEGYAPHLLHIAGLNRSYFREQQYAKKLAEVLGYPLVVRQVQLRGRAGDGDLDNRLKNQFIMGIQLDYAAELGAAVVGQGNHSGDHLGVVAPYSWFTDAREVYAAYEAAVGGGIGYRCGLLENVSFVYRTLADMRPDVLPWLGSCIHPHRFQDLRRKQTEAKWGIQPLPHRCGVCYKCAWEYLVLAELPTGPKATPLYPWHPEYALHCLRRVWSSWHLFYRPETKPATLAAALGAIVDQRYTPTPKALEMVVAHG
jgi:hypothetical protein